MKYKVRENFTQNPDKILGEILQNRGVKNVEAYLNPTEENECNPYDLDNIVDAAEMILKHVKKESKIRFIVDSDCDGYTSSAMLYNYLNEVVCPKFKASPDFRYTCHEHKGHGFSDLMDELSDTDDDLIIAADAASYDKEQMAHFASMGVEIVSLDHHAPLLDEDGSVHMLKGNPHCIIVNNQLSPNYQNKDLCGAGIVYKLLEVFDDMLKCPHATDYIDLCALGNIADVMFMGNEETRYFIVEGLKHIRNEGFKALLAAQSFSLKDKAIAPYIGLTPIDIAFYIAPLINAITRLGTMSEKHCMFKAFTSPFEELQSTKRGAKKGDVEFAAQQNARVAGNVRARQNREKDRAIGILEARIDEYDLLSNNILFIIAKDEDKIPTELTGLIAQYFVSKYRKPCLITRKTSDGFYRGSARNDSNFEDLPNFKGYLEESGLFEYASGHASAFGASLPVFNLESFIEKSNNDFNESSFQNCYLVDYDLAASSENITSILMPLAENDSLWGNGVEQPKVIIKDIPITSPFFMGANKDNTKIEYNKISYVKFKDEDFAEKMKDNISNSLTVYGRLNLNTYAGKTTLQLFIDDYSIEKIDKYSF